MRRKFFRLSISVLAITLLILLVNSLVAPAARTRAQGVNLLQNPSFGPTGWYTKQGVDGQIPQGWDIWSSGSLKPVSDYNQYLPHARSAPGSWVVRTGSVILSGGGFASVAVTQGTTYRFSIYVFVHSCNDPVYACIGPDGRKSDRTLGSRVKIGVDPKGGTDPNSANVYWTFAQEAYDAFFPITIDAVAETAAMTVFTYSTVALPAWLNESYWDDASLVALPAGEGSPVNSGAGSAPGATSQPPPQTVPFVTPQQAQPDGSVVHTVGEGDTFDSIYVAYRHLGVTRDIILELNGWDEPPRWILIGEKIKILPPGSVDPATGRLLRTPGSATLVPTPTLAVTATAGPTPTPGGTDGDIQKGG